MLKHSDYAVGCDAHKHFSMFSVFDSQGKSLEQTRVNHSRGPIQTFLSELPPGTPVALETVGNWYWIVDEIEAAECVPLLAHAANWRDKYVSRLFDRIRRRKGHAVAVGAVARYLAEATYWVLTKDEPYREPAIPTRWKSPTLLKQGQARA